MGISLAAKQFHFKEFATNENSLLVSMIIKNVHLTL